MAARTSQAGPGGISLFPFMSILACLIGVLTLMIAVATALKSRDTGGRTAEELQRAQAFQQLETAAALTASELDALRQQHATADAAAAKTAAARDRAAVLRRQLDGPEAKDPAAASRNLQKQLEDLLTQLAQFVRERPALEKKVADLRAELEKRKVDPAAAPPPVIVQPGGTGSAVSRAKLFFVECTAEGIFVHQEGKPFRVTSAAIGADAAYNTFLAAVKKLPDARLIFLLREDGHGAWTRGAGLAESRFGLKTGKLPVPGKGEIDLTRFIR